MSTKDTLTTKQKRGIIALLGCPTIKEAARKADVSERQMHRWLRQRKFHDILTARMDEKMSASAAALVGMTGDALQTLHDLMTDGDVGAGVRERAAKDWLDATRRQVELNELAQRVAELEKNGG